MGSVNSATIVGNLGQDPEIRTTSSGDPVATLSIATSESWTDRAGQRQERTQWHRVVLWRKLAELAGRFLSKGSKVYVEGRIEYRSWEDPNTGQTRYSTEINARNLTFLDPKGGHSRPASDERRGGDTGGSGYGGSTGGRFIDNDQLPFAPVR